MFMRIRDEKILIKIHDKIMITDEIIGDYRFFRV